ncbi:RidA family protein [Pseudomonas putida]|jgi:enamine deaminase RidA (YjgF/YER057c/UK114 family)|uniref:Reactive intermediate/imine deaminase n=2 Tax=Pseudomonas putida group TaxID=136845 RepID=A0A1X1A0C9_PSEPU|nr:MULTISPECIES: RidA family protein [Pseudomonas]EKT4454196.1 RidA family protein [Pseudomonas putida]EKT4469591.1 RidA family protein [Pseudomonas putida]EKT4495841.1 RidA family protein [Pseudomonas putida]EKT4511011.1 RidA family protein [Pseudomonas putida]EKT4527824.1 RidA family protein [Pseudomonas putida]
MKHAIKTELFASRAPLEWAVVGNGTLYTAQIPIDTQGQVVAGGIEAQTRQTLDNLRHTLEAAGSSLDAVTQVLIYVTDRRYLATVNAVYAEYFQAPYPNRAAVVVAGLAREEMLVELVVYACL